MPATPELSAQDHATKARVLLAQATEVFDAVAVQAALARMAGQINARFEQEGAPAFPLVLGVMGGAVVFAGQLLTRLSFPLEFDYIHVTRYGAKDHGGRIEWKVEPRADVRGRTVIVLDDILDEGETLAHVQERLLAMGATEVLLAVFADKAIGKPKPARPDYVGLVVPNKFLVGYGMDAYGYWRNLPGIWALDI
jgi:hypoxanthine phosphoribosyltransferase